MGIKHRYEQGIKHRSRLLIIMYNNETIYNTAVHTSVRGGNVSTRIMIHQNKQIQHSSSHICSRRQCFDTHHDSSE